MADSVRARFSYGSADPPPTTHSVWVGNQEICCKPVQDPHNRADSVRTRFSYGSSGLHHYTLCVGWLIKKYAVSLYRTHTIGQIALAHGLVTVVPASTTTHSVWVG